MKWIIGIFCVLVVGALLGLGGQNYFQQAGIKISSLTELDDHPDPTDAMVINDGSITKKIEHHNLNKLDIQHKTSSYSVQPDDCGRVFGNTGAAANITFTLPECESSPIAGEVGEGWYAIFFVTDTSHEFYIDPDAQDSIKDFSSGESGEYIYGDQVLGSGIKIVCTQCEASAGSEEDAWNMVSMGYIGVWTTQD